MAKPCTEPACPKPSRALGLCRAHYQARRRRLYGRIDYTPKKRPDPKPKHRVYQHLDCRYTARYRFTLPYPITRQERACSAHAEHLLGSRIPGITVEDIQERYNHEQSPIHPDRVQRLRARRRLPTAQGGPRLRERHTGRSREGWHRHRIRRRPGDRRHPPPHAHRDPLQQVRRHMSDERITPDQIAEIFTPDRVIEIANALCNDQRFNEALFNSPVTQDVMTQLHEVEERLNDTRLVAENLRDNVIPSLEANLSDALTELDARIEVDGNE